MGPFAFLEPPVTLSDKKLNAVCSCGCAVRHHTGRRVAPRGPGCNKKRHGSWCDCLLTLDMAWEEARRSRSTWRRA